MKYLLVLLTAALSTTKVMLQSTAAKKDGRSLQSSISFNMLMFLAAAALFCPYLICTSLRVWRFAGVYAICNVTFQVIYILALSKGNISDVVMFANFGMIVPIVMSWICYGDMPSNLRAAGIILTLAAFVFTFKQGRKTLRGYWILVILAMLTNGCNLWVQKVFALSCADENIFSFVSASYMLSALLCGMICGIAALSGQKRFCAIDAKMTFTATGSGVSLALFLALNTYAAKVSDASFHYPTHSGSTILLSVLMGFFIFREKPQKRQFIACLLGCAAMVLMNF